MLFYKTRIPNKQLQNTIRTLTSEEDQSPQLY